MKTILFFLSALFVGVFGQTTVFVQYGATGGSVSPPLPFPNFISALNAANDTNVLVRVMTAMGAPASESVQTNAMNNACGPNLACSSISITSDANNITEVVGARFVVSAGTSITVDTVTLNPAVAGNTFQVIGTGTSVSISNTIDIGSGSLTTSNQVGYTFTISNSRVTRASTTPIIAVANGVVSITDTIFAGCSATAIVQATNEQVTITGSNFIDNVCSSVLACVLNIDTPAVAPVITGNTFFQGSPDQPMAICNSASFDIAANSYCGRGGVNIQGCGNTNDVVYMAPDSCGVCGGQNELLNCNGECFLPDANCPVVSTLTVGMGGMFATIQEAIGNATNGDRIELLPGTHNITGAGLTIPPMEITIAGETGQASDVIVQYFGSGGRFLASANFQQTGADDGTFPFHSRESTVFEDFTITSGDGLGVVQVTTFSRTGATFRNVRFLNNPGLAVLVGSSREGSPYFENCQWLNQGDSAIDSRASALEVVDSQFLGSSLDVSIRTRDATNVIGNRFVLTNNVFADLAMGAVEIQVPVATPSNFPTIFHQFNSNSFANVSGTNSILCDTNAAIFDDMLNTGCDGNAAIMCTGLVLNAAAADSCRVCGGLGPDCSLPIGICYGPNPQDSLGNCCLITERGPCGDCMCTTTDTNQSSSDADLMRPFALMASALAVVLFF